jgi:hypothetical protein
MFFRTTRLGFAIHPWRGPLRRLSRCSQIAAASMLLPACTSAPPPGVDPGPEGEGACVVEARNETEVALEIRYRAGLVQAGILNPGGRLRFNVGCRDGSVVVLGSKPERPGVSGAPCNVAVRVTPVEGRVVVAALRMTRNTQRSSNPSGCRRGTTSASDSPLVGRSAAPLGWLDPQPRWPEPEPRATT